MTYCSSYYTNNPLFGAREIYKDALRKIASGLPATQRRPLPGVNDIPPMSGGGQQPTPVNGNAIPNGGANTTQQQPHYSQSTGKNPPPGSGAKPLNFFSGLGDIWDFLIARIRMWWYKNKIKNGTLTADQWNTVHKDAKTLSENRFGRAVGNWINPEKYNDEYFRGLPTFFQGAQVMHDWGAGRGFGVDTGSDIFNKNRKLALDSYNFGVKHGLIDEDTQNKYGKHIANINSYPEPLARGTLALNNFLSKKTTNNSNNGAQSR